MKKSYQRLFIFEMILFSFLLLNSFVWNILNNYTTVIFLFSNIIIFKFVLGLEKDRHRYVKDIIFDICIILLISFMFYYIFGIIIGFYRVGNFYDWYGIKTFIFPIILSTILKEYLRYQMLNKSEGSFSLIIFTIILFAFLEISTAIYYEDFSTSHDIFIFFSLILLPSLSRNIVCSYISIKIGYKPNIIWILVFELYSYLLPIIPNPNEYILSIIRLVFPMVIMWKVNSFFQKANDYEVERDYKKQNKWTLLIPTLIVAVIIYFTSGYFEYYAIAVASGSMSPAIYKGDIVIVEKNNDYKNLQVGQILTYKYENIVVVHRIVDIIEDKGEYFFYTKGDANNSKDNYVIKEDMIIGIVNYRIPYIGLPTVWLNNL